MSIFNKRTLEPTTGSPSNPTSGGPIYGVDVYHEDDVTSWVKMKASGIEFVYIKASQGLSYDPKFMQYYSGAKSAGLIVGAYHFYSMGSNQRQQADFFNKRLQAVGYVKEDLPPCFDFEKASGDFSSSDANNALIFLNELQAASGRLPMLYMSQSTYTGLNKPSWMLKYPWWLARYRSEALGPGTDNWVLWQFSESATIAGLANKGDKNKFRGSLEDLKIWISQT